jgi:hypothetical protein
MEDGAKRVESIRDNVVSPTDGPKFEKTVYLDEVVVT